MSNDLLYYRGCQFQPGRLPKGADPDEVMTLAEYLASARTDRPAAVPADADAGVPAKAAGPVKKAAGRSK